MTCIATVCSRVVSPTADVTKKCNDVIMNHVNMFVIFCSVLISNFNVKSEIWGKSFLPFPASSLNFLSLFVVFLYLLKLSRILKYSSLGFKNSRQTPAPVNFEPAVKHLKCNPYNNQLYSSKKNIR